MGSLRLIEELFVDRVWEHFKAEGTWPTATALEIEFRKEGNAKKIAARIGRDLVVWEGSSANAICYLTLKGVASRPDSELTIENFLDALRYLGQRYVEAGGDVSVSAEKFVTNLGLSEKEARQAADLIFHEPELSGATIPPSPAWPSFKPYRLAMHIEDVRTLDEYWQICQRFEEDEREASVLIHNRSRSVSQESADLAAGFTPDRPLIAQLRAQGLEFDQKLARALEVSASRPDLDPEDVGFPDSYLTLALYRLNSALTPLLDLDETRLNLFHEYKKAPPCKPTEVVPGHRLCRVMEKAAGIASPGKTIGCGHFLRAIVALSLDEEPEEAYGFRGQVLHNTFSAETLLWGLGYSAWTPFSQATEVEDILAGLDGRAPIEDFQYLVTVENDRMVFRPTSILGSYQMETESGLVVPQTAILTHFKDRYAGVTPDEILELEDLINNPNVQEPDLQRFFEDHPHLLRLWDFRQVHPQVYLTREDEGPLVPDFILVDTSLQRSMLLDLKLPTARTVVRKKNRDRFSALVDEARAQLLEYRDWFEDRRNRESLKGQLGMEVFRPRLAVLIGSAEQFHGDFDRQKLASRYPDIEIATYDDIRRLAERRLVLVKSALR